MIPNLDEIIEMYITEALQAFGAGLMFSSTVMLGAASERGAYLLFTSFVEAIKNSARREKLEKKILEQKRSYKEAFENFRSELANLPKPYLPGDLKNDLEIQIDGILNWIRVCRNDAGHPTGRKIERPLAYANLQLFIPYCCRIYDLINHFVQNPIT
jgi:hypothetical protein